MKYIVRDPDNLVIAVIDQSLSREMLIGLTDMMTAQSGIPHTGYDGELPTIVYQNSIAILCLEIGIEDVRSWADAVEEGLSGDAYSMITLDEIKLAGRIFGRELTSSSFVH